MNHPVPSPGPTRTAVSTADASDRARPAAAAPVGPGTPVPGMHPGRRQGHNPPVEHDGTTPHGPAAVRAARPPDG